mgnify:CR=1 FL=1
MIITIKEETQKLILSNEELDNPNFIDLELYDEEVKDEDNPRGLVSECTMPIEELMVAVNCFWNIKENSK